MLLLLLSSLVVGRWLTAVGIVFVEVAIFVAAIAAEDNGELLFLAKAVVDFVALESKRHVTAVWKTATSMCEVDAAAVLPAVAAVAVAVAAVPAAGAAICSSGLPGRDRIAMEFHQS